MFKICCGEVPSFDFDVWLVERRSKSAFLAVPDYYRVARAFGRDERLALSQKLEIRSQNRVAMVSGSDVIRSVFGSIFKRP